MTVALFVLGDGCYRLEALTWDTLTFDILSGTLAGGFRGGGVGSASTRVASFGMN